MSHDGGDDNVPSRVWQFMARLLQREELGARDLVHQCQGMSEGEDGIPVAMNDESRHLDRAQPVPEWSTDVHRKVVDLARGDIDGTVEFTTDQIAQGRFVEPPE